MVALHKPLVTPVIPTSGWETSLRWQHRSPTPAPDTAEFIRRKWLVQDGRRERVVYEEFRGEAFALRCACDNNVTRARGPCAHVQAVQHLLEKPALATAR